MGLGGGDGGLGMMEIEDFFKGNVDYRVVASAGGVDRKKDIYNTKNVIVGTVEDGVVHINYEPIDGKKASIEHALSAARLTKLCVDRNLEYREKLMSKEFKGELRRAHDTLGDII